MGERGATDLTDVEVLTEAKLMEGQITVMEEKDIAQSKKLEDWVRSLIQDVDKLEENKCQVATERKEMLNSLEQALDELTERLKPTFGMNEHAKKGRLERGSKKGNT